MFGNKASIKGIGTCDIEMLNPKTKQKYDVTFVVVNENCTPLIGATTAQVLKLIEIHYDNIAKVTSENVNEFSSKEEVTEQYKDVFEGMGKMNGKVHLELDRDQTPVVMPPRRVPLAVKDDLKNELDRLESLGIFEKVVQSTDWVSALVVVQKPNGKIRVYV